jgi:hypothetical protein
MIRSETTVAEDVTPVTRSLTEQALFEESARLTAHRRGEFHAALAGRLELDGAIRSDFLRLLREADAEALRDTASDVSSASGRGANRLSALQELLGRERFQTYIALRETRRDWYQPSAFARETLSAADMNRLGRKKK